MGDTTGATAGRSKDTQAEPERFPVDQLTREARARFGVSPLLAVGALSEAPRKNLTAEEAEDLIRDFGKSKREVF